MVKMAENSTPAKALRGKAFINQVGIRVVREKQFKLKNIPVSCNQRR
jgi:hypothetical protein